MMKLKSFLSRANRALTESPFMSILFLSLLMLIGGGNSVKAADVEWDVTSSGTYSFSGTNNVTLKNRTFTGNQWTSICLPFDASKTVLDATFGEGNYNIQQFESVDGTTLKFKKVTSITAATPYFIKVNSTKVNPVFSGVTCTNQNSGWKDVTINSDYTFRGYYYCIYAYNLVNGQSTTDAFVIKSDGSLGSYKTWGEISYVGDNQRYGIEAFIYSPNAASKPTLSFEGGFDISEEPEGGDDDTPTDPTETAVDMVWDANTVSSTPSEYAGKLVNCKIKNKTYTANQWSVLCLPFSVNKSVLDATFPEGYEVQKLSSMTGDKFNFTKITAESFTLTGGTPYLIKSNSTVTEPTFSAVRLNASETKLSVDGGTHYIQGKLFVYGGYTVWSNNVCFAWYLNSNGLIAREKNWIDSNPGITAYFGCTDISKKLSVSIEGFVLDTSTLDMTDEANLTYAISQRAQLTNVPTLYIDIPDAVGVADLNTVLYKDRSKNEAPYLNATIQVVDNSDPSSEQHLESFTDNVKIKVRGNSTSELVKKPYRLNFAKELKDSEGNVIATCQKHDMLGLGYSKRNWALLANYMDGSLIRNALSYRVGQLVGMDFCPGYKFVDVVINGEYRGSYQISDHVEVGTNRINVNEDTGWYVENSRQDMIEEPSVNAGGLLMSIKNPEPKTKADTLQLKSEVTAFFTDWGNKCNAIGNQYSTYAQDAWRYVTDLKSLVAFYIGTNLTANYDGFMTVKMFKEANDPKIHFGPLWDHDLAFGSYTSNEGSFVEDENNGNFNGYVRKFFTDPVFIKMVHDKWQEMGGSNAIVADLQAYVTKLVDMVSQTQALDQVRWPGVRKGFNSSYNTYDEAITHLNSFIGEHIPDIGTKINTQYTALGGDEITIPEDLLDPVTPPAPTRQQLTNLPTIYLDAATVDDAWKGVALEVFDKDNVLGQGVTWTKTTADVSVQYQGSGDKNKDSYRLKFESKIKLMGANKYKQWVLLANDDDPSMINNALAKELGDAVGMPWTPGYQFVDLYVNDTYMGTYQVTDRVKAEDGRSLVSGGNKDADWQVRFNDATELAEDKTTDYITATNGVNVIYKNPDPKDLTTDQVTALRTDMKDYFDNVFTKTNGTYPNFAANVDKEQLINWYICQEILGVYKGFSSIEAYRSVTDVAADNLLHFGPLWDSEKGFGNLGGAPAMSMADKETANSYLGLMTNYAAYDEMKDLFNYLWTQPWFGSGVRDKWNAIKTAGLLATLKSKADAISGILSESQPKNAEKWTGSLGGSTYETAVANIKSYLDTRFEYLDTKFNARAAGLCDHTFTYVDNGDGTHKHYCTKCDYTDVESEAHTLTMVSGKAKCSVCGLEMAASVTGNEGEKVYILNAGKAGAQYITKTSGFIPTANTLYPINEKPEEGTVFDNVYWTTDGVNYADNIIVTDGTAWLGDVKVSAKNATYERTMSASSVWGTVCLPFKTEKNDDVTLYELASSTADLSGNGNMVFIEAKSTGGLTPLVYKKNNASATNVSFKCSPQGDGYVTVKAADKMSKNTSKNVPTNWQFNGNVKGTQTLTTSATATPALYYIASNKFWHATGTLDVTPFRAYFSYTPADGSTPAKAFNISFSDEHATSIESMKEKPLAIFIDKGSISLVSDKKTVVKIHNISGSLVTNTLVGAGECKTISLPAGLYIVNGTKITVK